MERVFISFVGSKDPVFGCYDGPILNIFRTIAPTISYLLLTDATDAEENKKKFFIERALLENGFNVSPDSVIFQKFDTNGNPAQFKLNEIGETISRIMDAHPGAEFFANVTSGTQQLISSLCLDIVSNDRNVKTFQTLDPQYSIIGYTEKKGSTESDFKKRVAEDIASNRDRPHSWSCRSVEVDIASFRYSAINQALRKQIADYNYEGAHDTISQQGVGFLARHDKLIELISYGRDCSAMRKIDENALLTGFGLYRYKGDDSLESLIAKYYIYWERYFLTKDYSSYILKMTPIVYELAHCFLRKYVKPKSANYDKFWDMLDKHSSSILEKDINKLKIDHPKLGKCLKPTSFGVVYFDVEQLCAIIEYFNFANLPDGPCLYPPNALKAFKKLRDYNSGHGSLRNELAHTINVEKQNETYGIGSFKFEVESRNIHDIVLSLVNTLFSDKIDNFNLGFFDSLNEIIIKNIN